MGAFSFCTTFNQTGYDKYARNSLFQFDRSLPEEVNYYAYVQSAVVDLELSKIRLLDFDAEVNGYKEYKKKYFGKKPQTTKTYQAYEYQHIRFCHKVYAVLSHFEDRKDDRRYIGWIDADVVPKKPIPLTFFNSLVKEGCFMSLLERQHAHADYTYAECGFMVWDTTLGETKEYFKRVREQYDKGVMFAKYLDIGWHDSIIWDYEMRAMRSSDLVKTYNLSQPSQRAKIQLDEYEVKKHHPFVKGMLGEYMDHLKGERKDIGFSEERLRVWS